MAQPVGEVDHRFSADDAVAVPWATAEEHLTSAEIYWLSTVRADGRPHVTPLIAVWFQNALWFCTGPGEQKAVNLRANPRCAITTGSSSIAAGLDLVVEGQAEPAQDETILRTLAERYTAKYGAGWTFSVEDGAFFGGGGRAVVYRVEPMAVFGFSKGDFAQTRWRFPA
jgi:nitroimidazol reductase NimA-like FMN-containing flavoprotein (pyridoxamine 5'-phosphate oxidase superfamily)